MKKCISLMLAVVMLLALTACGADDKETVSGKNETTVSNENPGETTLSPREEFEQMKQAMAELNKETEEVEAVPASFTADGLTVTLDSSFEAGYNAGESLMSYNHYSDTMTVSVTRTSNYFGYTTSREIAEDIASQEPETRTVASANGVYYFVQSGSTEAIKAYYVDNSGYYWVVVGYTRGGADFESCKAQLIQFCTSGQIN